MKDICIDTALKANVIGVETVDAFYVNGIADKSDKRKIDVRALLIIKLMRISTKQFRASCVGLADTYIRIAWYMEHKITSAISRYVKHPYRVWCAFPSFVFFSGELIVAVISMKNWMSQCNTLSLGWGVVVQAGIEGGTPDILDERPRSFSYPLDLTYCPSEGYLSVAYCSTLDTVRSWPAVVWYDGGSKWGSIFTSRCCGINVHIITRLCKLHCLTIVCMHMTTWSKQCWKHVSLVWSE